MKTFRNTLVYVLLIIICVIAIFPFIWTFFASTHNNTQIFKLSYSFIFGNEFLSNYKELAQSFPIWKNMLNSTVIAAGYTVGVLVIDSMAGFAFAKYDFKGKRIIFSICMMGMFIPIQVTIIPLFIEVTKMNLINSAWSIILPGLSSIFGVFLMRQNMLAFPDELIEASRIDGAGDFRIFARVVIPNMLPALTSLGILSFVNQWGNFMWPLVALNSKGNYTMPLVLSLMVQPGYVTNYGAVMVGAIMTVMPVLILFLFFQQYFIDGMLCGAVKG